MNVRLRVAATSLATVALFAIGTAIFPSATASAQSSDTGSAGSSAAQQPDPPQGELAGANDWACTPSPNHPRPVVLVHGTGLSMQESWGNPGDKNAQGPLVKQLKDAGYCLFALNYGYGPAHSIGPIATESGWGHDPIDESAATVADFIDDVRAKTGSAQVDIVGHSQGGTLTRQYLRTPGSAGKVRTLVMLGPSNHGTVFWGTDEAAARSAGWSKAIQQQTAGSTFLTDLNKDGETLPGIEYTVIASSLDNRILPYTSSFLIPAPGTEQSVHQKTVQVECDDETLAIRHARKFPDNPDTNVGLLDHPASLFLVRKALDPTLQGTIPCSG